MTTSYLIDKSLIDLASLGNLLLFLFKECIFNHKINQVWNILGVDTSFSALKLGSYKGGVLQEFLYEVNIAHPELQIKIKWQQGSFVEHACSLEFALFFHLKTDVSQPRLFLLRQTDIILKDASQFILKRLSLWQLVLCDRVNIIFC